MDMTHNESQNKCDVLVIDDDLDTLDLVLAFFSKKGIRAKGLSNSKEFIGALLDVMIPGFNGYDLCREIKGSPNLSKIAVYFMTAMPPADVSQHVRSCCADGFIPKPFSLQDLEKVVALASKR
jgi:DNA-binding response OmpR family regulator